MLKQGINVLQHCRFLGSLILLFFILDFAQAQQTDALLNLDFRERPLEEVLNFIAQQSGVSFSYNPRKIPVDQKITYSARQKSLNQVMEDIATIADLSFELVEGQMVIKPQNRVRREAVQHVTLSGFITDANNGEALIGATVIVSSLQIGATSNAFGFYSITLPKGHYEISYSFVGFKKSIQQIELNQSLSLNSTLQPTPSVLEEIIVTSSIGQVIQEVQLSKTNLRPSTVSEKPAFFGEADAIKALEAIPGVKMHSDGSTFYYVRGGDRDQNLILIDDAPIFNPSHLLGLFSTIIPEAVNDISFYKGSMPASLGGRISSVMDVRTKKGNDQHFQASGNVGLLSTKLTVEGPIKKDKSSYLLSSRLSRVKWLFRLTNDDVQKFHFYDLTGKVNFDLNDKNRLFLSFYNGSDNFFTSNNGIKWSNRTTTLRWNHVFNEKLFLNTTLAGGVYDYFLHTDISTRTKWNSYLSNINLKADFSYFKNPNEEIDFGVAFGGYNFNPGNVSRNGFSVSPIVSVRNSNEFVLYGNHEMRLNNKWGINYGLRFSTWTNEGDSFEFIFDDNRNPVDTLFYGKGERYQRYENVEPRLSLSYFINDNASIKTSYSRNIQNIHLITNSVSPFSSFEVWLPSSINIKPQIANQLVLGYYRYFTSVGVTLELESFYKRMNNQIDYEAHAETLLNPLLERELRFGKASAYGSEIQFKKEEGRLRAWAGYTYSRAKRKFANINEGRTFNAFYDRPHQINFMLSYDFNLRWSAGLNWNYYTGAPFSSPVSFYSYNGLEVPLYGQKNNDRLPDYHRLDLSATLHLNKNTESKFKHELSFSIFNFYGRKNALFVNYNKTEQSDGSFKIPSNLLDKNTVSTQFYLFQFTPAIAYNFKWR